MQNEIDLYKLIVDQHHRYVTILWQFPVAVAAANFLVLRVSLGEPWLLLSLSVLNAALIYSLAKINQRQTEIMVATRHAEDVLRAQLPDFLPTFKRSKLSAPRLVVWMLGALNAWLALYAIRGMWFSH